MYPYPCFEDFGLIVTCMQKYNSDFVVCAKKQKLRRCKKHKKYNTHTKTFSNYIWLCVVNGKLIRVIAFYINEKKLIVRMIVS